GRDQAGGRARADPVDHAGGQPGVQLLAGRAGDAGAVALPDRRPDAERTDLQALEVLERLDRLARHGGAPFVRVDRAEEVDVARGERFAHQVDRKSVV